MSGRKYTNRESTSLEVVSFDGSTRIDCTSPLIDGEAEIYRCTRWISETLVVPDDVRPQVLGFQSRLIKAQFDVQV